MSHHTAASRAGFTIVEQLVALIILGVGLLAIAQGVVGLQRQARRATASLNATAAASSAVDRLSVTSCAPAAGADTVGRVTVRWTRDGGSPTATIAARAVTDVDGRQVGDSLTSARDCRTGA